MRPIAVRLMFGFLLVIVIISLVFSALGVQLIGKRIVDEAQAKVHTDLNLAREIYLTNLREVRDTVQFTAQRFYLRDALLTGDLTRATEELVGILNEHQLDIFTITDRHGVALLRAANPSVAGDRQDNNELVQAVLASNEAVAATALVSADELRKETPALADRAYFKFVDTPMARERPETEETAGMMLKAASPIFDYENELIGVLYGGVLLNRRFEIVDKVKQIVFQDLQYEGKDIGTATIFQDDTRISTNVLNEDNSRAIGTRVTEEVYNRVVREGGQWIARAYVVNNWYISAYEPIRNIEGTIIGILYVGILEQPYVDIRRQTTLVFVAITLSGALLTIGISYVIARRISVPITKLVDASRDVAHGNLDANVVIRSDRELAELADAFNSMASALKTRDEKLKDFAKKKIMESERLAIVGQLAADVAHEINNPLQGIVTYAHLLLEKLPPESPIGEKIDKIAHQANRCMKIIRGLLEFSRQQKPHKKLARVKPVLHQCLSLVEDQALFHNIEIVKNFDGELPPVVMDPSQIEQVFMNMIINAAEAMNGDGRLAVTTRLDPGAHAIEVDFADTGHGITEENMERIFDPFFTSKDVGHGTGLGLAISFGIIKEHSGSISVESAVDEGATFTVRLPVTESNGQSTR
jgi:two-component system NtrC family sensor kinase